MKKSHILREYHYYHGKERMILVKDSNFVFKKVWRCRKCGKKDLICMGQCFMIPRFQFPQF